MYAVTPRAEAAWEELLSRVLAAAGLDFDYFPCPAPQPLEALWTRRDLGCVLMCGYPIALGLSAVVPIAAPVPALDWAGGKPLYRTDLVVRAETPYRRLEDTFGGRLGWTVEHSHSGFNALRHHLLSYRTAQRPILYGETRGRLITARAVLDAVVAGEIDVGPLDGYWHALLQRHQPELAAKIRVLASTDLAPMPAFVAAPGAPSEAVAAMKRAFAAASGEAWFPALSEALCLGAFAPVGATDFATTLAWDRDAMARGYPLPA
jgi:ABC-type phosphate/phosphonate transport system substrate-binding protein